MNRHFAVIFAAVLLPCAFLHAQDNDQIKLFQQIDQMGAGKEATPTPAPATSGTAPEQAPTIITATKETTFDSKAKVAVLYGDVKVVNPQFTLHADKLTIYFKKAQETPKNATPGASPTSSPKKQTPAPAPTAEPAHPGASASPAPARDATGGIEKVVAEGNVTIDSDRPDPNGGATVHYSGKGTKVDYNPATGEMVLSGMPELQKDMDELVATDESTVIFLNRDGMMDAKGPHKIKIVDPGPDKSPTPKPSKTPEITLPTPQQ